MFSSWCIVVEHAQEYWTEDKVYHVSKDVYAINNDAERFLERIIEFDKLLDDRIDKIPNDYTHKVHQHKNKNHPFFLYTSLLFVFTPQQVVYQ